MEVMGDEDSNNTHGSIVVNIRSDSGMGSVSSGACMSCTGCNLSGTVSSTGCHMSAASTGMSDGMSTEVLPY